VALRILAPAGVVLALLAALSSGAATAEPAIFVFNAADGSLLTASSAELSADTPIGPGSTLKPFLFAAALEGGLLPRQSVACPARPIAAPAHTRCWLASGHGQVDFVRGLAESCAVYTRHACRFVDADRYRRLLAACGLQTGLPPRETFRAMDCEAWMGAAPGILATPRELAQAYRVVFARSSAATPVKVGLDLLRDGLRECCLTGTGAPVREQSPLLSILGKTGSGQTADGRPLGVFVGLTPADAPTQILVALVPDAAGKEAARAAGRYLASAAQRTPLSSTR
jgi:hypothetical protein